MKPSKAVEPLFSRPPKPDPTLIELLHRIKADSEAGVTLAYKPRWNGSQIEGRFTGLCTVPIAELREIFPQFVEQLEADSYFSINSFVAPRLGGRGGRLRPPLSPDIDHIEGIAHPEHRQEWAQHLNACYVDLDIYRVHGLDQHDALAHVLRLARNGKLPQPSLIVDSGQGLWALWLLRDNRAPNESPQAFPSLKRKYVHINRELTERLSEIGADRQAIDVSRFLRVPGSKNRKNTTGARVGYWVPLDENQQHYTYTLDELEQFLGIESKKAPQAIEELRESDPNRVERGHRGALGVWLKALQRFETLRELRRERRVEVFPKGQRSRALRYAAGCLVAVHFRALAVLNRGEKLSEYALNIARMEKKDLRAYLHDVCADCEQIADDPVTNKDADSAFRAAWSKRGFGSGAEKGIRSQTVADWFQITQEEAAKLPATSAGPFPCASTAAKDSTFGGTPLQGLWLQLGKATAAKDEDRKALYAEAAATARTLGRDEAALFRRSVIEALLVGTGQATPSLRTIREMLSKFGAEASTRTIALDLKALGLVNPRSRQARKRRSELLEAAARPLFPDITEGRKP